jgi:hypothetical protein
MAWQASARAEDVDSLLRQGVQLRKQGKDREALGLFQRAVEIEKTPRALAQLGLAEQSLGLWPKAEAHIKDALAATDDTWIKKNRATLEESSRTIGEHLGSLEIWGDPAGAEVLFNGTPVGTLPATGTVRVETGQVTFTVRAKGFEETTRTVQVKSGDALRENVALVTAAPAPEASGPGARPALALGAPTPGPSNGTPSLVERPTSSSEEAGARPVYARWWFWTAIGTVVAGGVVAAIVLSRGHASPCDQSATCTTWGS